MSFNFYNYLFDDEKRVELEKESLSIKEKSISELKQELGYENLLAFQCYLDLYQNKNLQLIDKTKFKPSYESMDDDPFADIGEDGSDTDSFADEEDSFVGDEGDDPFSDIGDDSGDDDMFGDDSMGDDMFGDDGSDDGDGGKKKKKEVDRKESTEEEHNISNNIRKVLPDKIYNLLDIIDSNIVILNKLYLDYNLEESVRKLKSAYDQARNMVSRYIKNMADKTYDDIFTNYLKFYNILSRLRDVYENLTNSGKTPKDIDELIKSDE